MKKLIIKCPGNTFHIRIEEGPASLDEVSEDFYENLKMVGVMKFADERGDFIVLPTEVVKKSIFIFTDKN